MRQLLFIAFFCSSFGLHAQSNWEKEETPNKNRLIGSTAFTGTCWAGSITGLYFVWYKDFDKSGFHFFDDSHEWLQMDKMGHFAASNYFARYSGDLYEWSGLDHKKSSLIGAGFSTAYMLTFEFLDAYNTEWGFSWSDLGFNAVGSLTYWAQEYLWDYQYAKVKFSAQNSGLAQYRPEVLGNSPMSRILKDYNGQTYWLSMNPFNWTHEPNKFPKWLNLSLGYGIHDQLVGDGSTYTVVQSNSQLTFTPYRQYFLSLDIDFEEIPVEKTWLKVILRGINFIKVPFPALEFSNGKIIAHPLYF